MQDGLGAVKAEHHAYLDEELRSEFADSLELDESLRAGREQENRWDYLLGHSPTAVVIAVEPHHATQDQISTIVAKKRAARDQLQSHLRPAALIMSWLWVASGKVHFADTEKARRRLDQHGIQFVGRKVLRKHLPKGVLNP